MFTNDTVNNTEGMSYTMKSVSRSVMSFIFLITSLVGNVLVLNAIYRFKRLRTCANVIIGNLSFADVLFSTIVAPVNAYYWSQDESRPSDIACHVTGVGALLFGLASIYTLVFVSIERFLATNFPLKHRQLLTTRFIKYGILTVWLLSLAICIFTYGVSRYRYIKSFYHCIASWDDSLIFTMSVVFVGNLVPLAILIYCNIRVCSVIWRRTRKSTLRMSRRNGSKETKQQQKKVSVIVMMIIGVFAICWTPYCIAMMCLAVDGCSLPQEFMSLAVVLTIANGSFNPLIYGLMNKNYRNAFSAILGFSKEKVTRTGSSYNMNDRSISQP